LSGSKKRCASFAAVAVFEESLGHPIASTSGGRVLEPGDGGLARQLHSGASARI
jgi:hypothetical protein